MRKAVSVLVIIAMTLILFTSPVKAASFKFSATPTSEVTNVEVGDTITIDLKISDIDAGQLGINTVQCIFLYDESVFELVSKSAKNNWSITYNDQQGNEQYGTLLAVLVESGVTEDQEIGQITLKVKDDAQGKTGKITFTEVFSNDGTNRITDTDKTIEVTVKGDENSGNNGNNDNTNSINTGNSSVNNVNSANSANNANVGSSSQSGQSKNNISLQVENVSKEPIPQTGLNESIVFICISGAVVIGLIAYIRYKKIER